MCLGGSQTSGNSTEAQVVTSELNYRTSVRSSVYDYDAVTAQRWEFQLSVIVLWMEMYPVEIYREHLFTSDDM